MLLIRYRRVRHQLRPGVLCLKPPGESLRALLASFFYCINALKPMWGCVGLIDRSGTPPDVKSDVAKPGDISEWWWFVCKTCVQTHGDGVDGDRGSKERWCCGVISSPHVRADGDLIISLETNPVNPVIYLCASCDMEIKRKCHICKDSFPIYTQSESFFFM